MKKIMTAVALTLALALGGAAYASGPANAPTTNVVLDTADTRLTVLQVSMEDDQAATTTINQGNWLIHAVPVADTHAEVTACFDVQKLAGSPSGATFIGVITVTGQPDTKYPRVVYSPVTDNARQTVCQTVAIHRDDITTQDPQVSPGHGAIRAEFYATHGNAYLVRRNQTHLKVTWHREAA